MSLCLCHHQHRMSSCVSRSILLIISSTFMTFYRSCCAANAAQEIHFYSVNRHLVCQFLCDTLELPARDGSSNIKMPLDTHHYELTLGLSLSMGSSMMSTTTFIKTFQLKSIHISCCVVSLLFIVLSTDIVPFNVSSHELSTVVLVT